MAVKQISGADSTPGRPDGAADDGRSPLADPDRSVVEQFSSYLKNPQNPQQSGADGRAGGWPGQLPGEPDDQGQDFTAEGEQARPQSAGPGTGFSAAGMQATDKNISGTMPQQPQGQSQGQKLQEEPGPEADGMSELSSIFSSLFSPGTGTQAGAAPAQTPVITQSSESAGVDRSALQQLADDLVDRILVSDPRYSQGSEIRLTLSAGSGFPGTEIVLRRDLEGMLAVEINSRRQDHFKKFVELRPLLSEGLQQYENSEVRLIINNADEYSEAEENPD